MSVLQAHCYSAIELFIKWLSIHFD